MNHAKYIQAIERELQEHAKTSVRNVKREATLFDYGWASGYYAGLEKALTMFRGELKHDDEDYDGSGRSGRTLDG